MSDETAKHTPGPWVAERNEGHDGQWNIIGVGRLGVLVHEEFGSTLSWRGGQSDVEANARLIASAPELLMACLQLQSEIEGKVPKHRHEMPNTEGFCMMRAAIAKAEGS